MVAVAGTLPSAGSTPALVTWVADTKAAKHPLLAVGPADHVKHRMRCEDHLFGRDGFSVFWWLNSHRNNVSVIQRQLMRQPGLKIRCSAPTSPLTCAGEGTGPRRGG